MVLCLVFAWTFVAGLHAQKEDTQRWAARVGGFVTTSSPAISLDGSIIYVGVEAGQRSGRVVALTAAAGSEVWQYTRSAPFVSSPALSRDGSVLYIGCIDARLYALDAKTGALKWSRMTGGYINSSPAIAEDGTIYVGSADGRLYAFEDRGTEGVERWKFPRAQDPAMGIIDLSSPAIAPDGTIYIGSLDRSLYAITPQGEKKWAFTTGSPIFSSPAIGADGTVFVGSNDQRLHAIAPDGTRRWDFFTGGVIDASPVLGADGTVYVASGDAQLYAFDPNAVDDLRVKWKTYIGVTIGTTAAVRGDGVIVLGGDDNRVQAFDPDGKLRWEFKGVQGDGDRIEAGPTIADDGSIYIGSNDGFLYRLYGNGSPLSVLSSWPAFRRDAAHSGRAIATNMGGQLANISTRAVAGGNNNLIAGFVVQGGGGKVYLLRGVGPGLAKLNVNGFLPDPQLDLFAGETVLFSNDNWTEPDAAFGFSVGSTTERTAAFLLDPGSKDAVIVPFIGTGVFTAQVRSVDDRAGVALVEIYDTPAGDADTRLINLSTRGHAGTDENVLIAGFVVRDARVRLLIRAVGPGLTQFGVGGTLSRPVLDVFRNQSRIATNVGWFAGGLKNDLKMAAASGGAFPLDERHADSALIFDASPGPYTIQISGVNRTTGEALAEIYVLP